MGSSQEIDFSHVDPLKVGKDNSCKPRYIGSTTEEHLIFLRDAFKNDIPDFPVHSNYVDSNYKVRGNWWYGLYGSLEMFTDENLLHPYLDEEVNLLKEHCLEHIQGYITSPEEIYWANRVINSLVRDYEEDHPELRENPPYTIPNPELCL